MNQKGLLVVQTDDDRLLTFSASGWYWLEKLAARSPRRCRRKPAQVRAPSSGAPLRASTTAKQLHSETAPCCSPC